MILSKLWYLAISSSSLLPSQTTFFLLVCSVIKCICGGKDRFT